MAPNLTRRQLEVLRFFRDYRNEHGLSPTLEEAATPPTRQRARS